MSIDISSMGENQTRVTLSTCESPSSRESRTAVNPDTPSRRKCTCRSPCLPSLRRVSFNDAVVEHDSQTIVQNDITNSRRDNAGRSDPNGEREIYDIWQANDSIGRSDDESTSRIDNYSENHVSDCIPNKGSSTPESIDETIANDGGARNGLGGESDVRQADRVTESTSETKDDDDDTVSNASDHFRKDVVPIDNRDGDEYRMRGGCGRCCAASREKNDGLYYMQQHSKRHLANTDDTTSGRDSVKRNSQGHGGSCCCCCCYCYCYCSCNGSEEEGGGLTKQNESCAMLEPSRYDGGVETACTAIVAACDTVPSRCRCRYVAQGCHRAVCKKTTGSDEVPARATGAQGCGVSGCCGVGRCRGGCGKPSEICTPNLPVRDRPRSSRGRSSYARSCCPARLSCFSDYPSVRSSCCGRNECGSLRCRRTIVGGSGCCINSTTCGTDGACRRLKKLPVGYEYLGGGLDCQRCGRKVYQAEMQIACGVSYHSSCFSCFCCRKPLEPLTYQENYGEIYCKQCYVRNFGPQGYGYGVGAGVLQTPM